MKNQSERQLLDRRRFCTQLAACSGLLALSGSLRLNAQRRDWTPPWRLPVASTRVIHAGGASIQVDFTSGPTELPAESVMQWIERAAQAVTIYYGRFPVPRERILVMFVPDQRGVFGGTTWGGVDGFPAFTRIHAGQHTTEQDLTDDWMMTHEMVHTAFPSQDEDHAWIEEGLATYVEPIARVQAGFLKPEEIWSDMARDMPKGDPRSDDEGLDRTHTWGRTYWGGAQFCLLADVTIRRQTQNQKGLQDALRAIVDSGRTIDQEWSLERAFTIADRATGTTVLMDQYRRMADTAVKVDLNELWRELGVVPSGNGQVEFDNHAPLSAVREAITQTPTAKSRNA